MKKIFHTKEKKTSKNKKNRTILAIMLLFPIIVSLSTKNPKDTSLVGNLYPAKDVYFLYDLSYLKNEKQIREHTIFEHELELIQSAEEYLILDLFLFNDEYPRDKMTFPNSVKTMTDALINKKKLNPSMPIILITDPINNFYGAYEQRHITRLKQAGIDVVITDLNKLKDSNPLLSGYYRCYAQWFGTKGLAWIPNIFDKSAPKINLRSIIKLSNFKGNHRKVLISEKEAIISSSNPHDASGYHSNIAVHFKGDMVKELLNSEKTVIAFSGGMVPSISYESTTFSETEEEIFIRLLTEKGIFDTLLNNIQQTKEGDEIRIAIFYLADLKVLDALGKAAMRGVDIKIIADPNKDAFGIEKNGNPNRPALCSFAKKYPSLQVRWYNTNGEQYHGKTACFSYTSKNETHIMLGSANFTRRNLEGYNLETDAELIMPNTAPQAVEINTYFDRLWNNQDGMYTLPLEDYYTESFLRNILWKIQEKTGICTW